MTLIDTHAHMDREGLKARCGYSLAGRHSVAAIVEAVKNAVARTQKGEWIVFLPMGTTKLGNISRPAQLAEPRQPEPGPLGPCDRSGRPGVGGSAVSEYAV